MARAKVSIALLSASLILLIIYGVDVMIASSSSNELFEERQGFLPFNEAVRGSAFGGSAVIMSIVGFAIARKEPSTPVVVLLFVNGGLIIVGMLALIGQGALASENASSTMRTIVSTMAMGGILVGLGVWKAVGDKRIPAAKNQQSKTS